MISEYEVNLATRGAEVRGKEFQAVRLQVRLRRALAELAAPEMLRLFGGGERLEFLPEFLHSEPCGVLRVACWAKPIPSRMPMPGTPHAANLAHRPSFTNSSSCSAFNGAKLRRWMGHGPNRASAARCAGVP